MMRNGTVIIIVIMMSIYSVVIYILESCICLTLPCLHILFSLELYNEQVTEWEMMINERSRIWR